MSGAPRWRVHWIVSSDADVYHGAKLLSGLSELSRQGRVSVRMSASSGPAPEPGIRRAIRWEVADGERRRELNLAIDLLDSAARIDPLSARECDVYLKRSFVKSEAARLAPAPTRCVFIPFGLNHSCLTASARTLLANAAWRRLVANTRVGRGLAASARGLAADLRMMAALPPPEAFENFESGGRTGEVLFQTRVWAPEPSTDDLPALNRERADLVRALRSAFPDVFLGGVVADAFSTAHFPNVVTRRSVHRAEYAAMSRRASVGVYSRGLHDSLAFKLSEYLAGGLCVVSSPLRHELPEPLEPGRHYLPYETAAECVAAVRRLSSDSKAAEAMRRENVAYYRANLAPAPSVVSVLERAFRARD